MVRNLGTIWAITYQWPTMTFIPSRVVTSQPDRYSPETYGNHSNFMSSCTHISSSSPPISSCTSTSTPCQYKDSHFLAGTGAEGFYRTGKSGPLVNPIDTVQTHSSKNGESRIPSSTLLLPKREGTSSLARDSELIILAMSFNCVHGVDQRAWPFCSGFGSVEPLCLCTYQKRIAFIFTWTAC